MIRGVVQARRQELVRSSSGQGAQRRKRVLSGVLLSAEDLGPGRKVQDFFSLEVP